eukprot:3236979-Alexandrium_andersonii.AAC.1
MELTWGVLRGHANGVGAATMDDSVRRQLLEDNVEAVPPSPDVLVVDQRRRQRLFVPMKGLNGSIQRREVYLPLDTDPGHPNGIGLV